MLAGRHRFLERTVREIAGFGLLAFAAVAPALGLGAGAPRHSPTQGAVIQEDWLLELGAIVLSSPILADVDGQGALEIVITTYCPETVCPGAPTFGGRVYVLTSQGSVMPGWPQGSNSAPFGGGAVVGDIDGDGDAEVVAGSWNEVFVWQHDGSLYPGWPKAVGTFSAPTLADLDADGDLEILYSDTTGRLLVWQHDGTLYPGWPYLWTGGTGQGQVLSPAVADLDRDGALEIAAGTGQGPFTAVPHDFFSWDADGSVRSGFPLSTLYQSDTVAIGDLDRDGRPELAFADLGFAGVACLNQVRETGAAVLGWPAAVEEVGGSAPAIGDLDGDGEYDLVVGGADIEDQNCLGPVLYAFDRHGLPLAGFPLAIPFTPGGVCPIIAPIVIVDLDGDSDSEVIVKARDAVHAYHGDGSVVTGFPYPLSDDGISSNRAPAPAFGDVDLDGNLDFVLVSVSGRVAFFDTEAATRARTRPWPMYKHDSLGTSAFGFVGLFVDGFESGDASAWSLVVP
jgi:hypothetical protein